MIEYIVMFVMFAVGVSIGWYLREQHAIRQIHKILNSAEFAEAVEQVEPRTKMRLERHGETIYAFEEEGAFIAQGKDLQELDTAIQKRFPGKKFAVQEQNLIDIKAEYHDPV